MTQIDPQVLLADAEGIRSRTGSLLHSYWFPLVLFGTLSVLSAPLNLIGDGRWVGLFWIVAAPLGSVATGRQSRRREERVGIAAPPLPYILTAAALILGTMVSGIGGGVTGHEQLADMGPYVFIGLGYLLFARLHRSRLVAAIAVGLLIADGLMIVANAGDAGAWLAAGFGLTGIIAGLFARGNERRLA